MNEAAAVFEQLRLWLEPYLAQMEAGAWGAPVALPLWLASGAAVLCVLLLLGWMFGGRGGGLTRLLLVIVAAVAAYKGVQLIEAGKRDAGRQALEERVARALAVPAEGNTLLACAGGVGNLDLRAACERTIFARPENVAAAVSLVRDRVDLLVAVDKPEGGLGPDDRLTARLRQSLEADDFGLVAHVLASNWQCAPDACAAFSHFREVAKIRANLVARSFEGLVEKHTAQWAPKPETSAAKPSAPAQAGGPASMAVGEVEAVVAPPGASTLWSVPQVREPAAEPPAAAPAAAAVPAPVPQPAPVAPRPPKPQQATSATSTPAAARRSTSREGGARGTDASDGRPARAATSAERRSSRPSSDDGGRLPPPTSLAPPPGTPPAPGVSAR